MELPDFLIKPKQLIQDRDIQPLDGDVYGIIYWYTKLRLQKCVLSNAAIGQLLHASPSGIANAIARLVKKKYVRSVMDDKNHRLELIPLIAFTPYSNEYTPLTQMSNPPYSNEEHNNIDIIIKRERKPQIFTSISYLLNIPQEDIEDFKSITDATEKQIRTKAESLIDYCKSKGKVYKDYKAFLRNALRRDYPKTSGFSEEYKVWKP